MTTSATGGSGQDASRSAAAVSVHALRYARRPDCMASHAFYRHDLYGEPDRAVGVDYFFWLVRTDSHTIVVDCGFSAETAAARNRRLDTTPEALLARMGTSPEDVDHVVLTHMHFDHVGNTGLFPNAVFHMARDEFEYWTGPHRELPAFSWPVEPSELRALEGLHQQGRLQLLQDEKTLVAGVELTRFPGHTPGQLVTHVSTGERQVVLASDALHYYDEMDRSRPFFLFTDLGQLLDTYQLLHDLDARPDIDVVAGHDPAVATMYAEVQQDCFDLLQPLPGHRGALRT
ncbi:N-acyl homoserine lactonase family protein [Streptomyces olivaceus]|uniref:N-acyl homoserine lactonase family protein n=1 Tax=Streptomyces olivaceus TaxID=47716 RepID=UPI004057872C